MSAMLGKIPTKKRKPKLDWRITMKCPICKKEMEYQGKIQETDNIYHCKYCDFTELQKIGVGNLSEWLRRD